jgi:hypothetical protein
MIEVISCSPGWAGEGLAMKQGRWKLGLSCGILVCVALAALLAYGASLRRPEEPTRDRRELLKLHLAAQAYVIEMGNFGADGRQENPAVLKGLLGANRMGMPFFRPRPENLAGGACVDSWKRPYVIYVWGSGKMVGGRPDVRAVVYSVGPNGVDELGEGDDVSWPEVVPSGGWQR